MENLKRCKCCGRELPIENFKEGRWGRTSVCLECETNHRREKKLERQEAAKRAKEDEIFEKKRLALEDFTPRELMNELARRGYKGTLSYTRVETIDIENF